jgi:hypothetical protein
MLGKRCRPGEAVVLRRWRDRSREPAAIAKGMTFDGCRLYPNTFRLLDACRKRGLKLDASITAESIQPYYDCARRQHPAWKAPNPPQLAALAICLAKVRRLANVLDRERTVANPGLPDLFLWNRNPAGVPFGGQFVEVKRRTRTYKEPLSKEQRDEIAFLKKIGAKARVVYLRAD